MKEGNSVAASMIYKTMERYLVMAFQLLVQIVIARILSPSEYGIVAMMVVFTNIAGIFINNGFNMAIVQKPQANGKDYSTALTINMSIGVSLYIILFFAAPYIEQFYLQEGMSKSLRILALLLIPGSLNSIQIAIATREMKFAKLMKCNLTASVCSGILGVVSALLGFGYWALIIQQLSQSVILSIVLLGIMEWRPSFDYDKTGAKEMFVFGWKILVAGLLNTIYNELNSLVIGKKYTSSDLAFYSKGKQIPFILVTGVDSSIQSVVFSALSKKQNDEKALHGLLYKAININSYVLFFCLGTLAVIAKPLVIILLTEKWLPLLPFLYICCFTMAFHPMASAQVQAITAVGRSDVRLKIELIKKSIGIILLVVAVYLDYGPMGIAISTAVTSILSVIIGAIACRITTRYPLKNVISDIFPIIAITAVMVVVMFPLLKWLNLNVFVSIVIGMVGCALIYWLESTIFKFYGLTYLKSTLLSNSRIAHIFHKKTKHD